MRNLNPTGLVGSKMEKQGGMLTTVSACQTAAGKTQHPALTRSQSNLLRFSEAKFV